MKLDIFEVINSVTMIFPFLAWWKHRRDKTKQRRVHALMRIHIPIAMTYHALNSICPTFPLTKICKALDLVCIHGTSIAAAKDRMKTYKPSKRPILYEASIPLHGVVLASAVAYKNDLPPARFGLIVMNNYPIIGMQKKNALPCIALSGSCFAFFHLSWQYPIGHGIFHMLLYKVYDDFFHLLENKDQNMA